MNFGGLFFAGPPLMMVPTACTRARLSRTNLRRRMERMPAESPLLRADLPPTRVRYGVLAFACALSMITYLDRVCMGSAAGEIVKDLHLGGIADLKWAFTLFGIAYAVFEVPSGWLGDVFG